jgi:hypothetical protein
MKTPHLHAPRLHMPHIGSRKTPKATTATEHQRHHNPLHRLQRLEGGIDLFAIALVVLFALAMIYGLLTATGHPAYFDRWPS